MRSRGAVLPGLALLGCLFAEAAAGVQVTPVQTLQGGIDFVTQVALGPEDPDPGSLADGCAYATDGDSGTLHRICFDAAKDVTSNDTVIVLNGGAGTNFLIGLAFDPASDTEGEIIVYLAWEPLETEPFSTRIARAVSQDGGSSYTTDELFVSGLGRSTVHTTNGIAFGPDGCLYLAKGNNSNAGFDPDFAESRLSGAVLRACFRNPDGSVDPGFDRDCGDGSFQEACDVEVYASGFRNPYDLVWHSNGRLYASDNDMDVEDNPGCGSVANTFGCACQEPLVDPNADELDLVEPGRYYGSPNPYLANPEALQCQGGTRAGFACTSPAECDGGGSCLDLSALCSDATCGEDVQCLYFGGGVPPPTPAQDPSGIYRAPIAQPAGARMNGLAEFGSLEPVLPGAFCSDWNGQLVAGGTTTNAFVPRRFALSPDGTAASDLGTAGLGGLRALDVAVGPDGTLYGARWSSDRIEYVTPVPQPDPDAAHFFAFCAGPGPCDARCQPIAQAPGLAPAALLALSLLLFSLGAGALARR
jgi:glucose/arabinose dehydrogenase